MPVIPWKKNHMFSIFDEYAPLRIKYKDIFNMKEFYDALHEYLLEHDWEAHDGDGEHWETYYGERIGQNGNKEIWIMWRLGKKAPETKAFHYYLDIYFHCINLAKTEIVRDGQKIKCNKGEVEVEISGFIQKLYEKDFKKEKGIFGWILKEVKEVFTNRIYLNVIDQRKKELYQEVYATGNFIKQWMKLKRYLPYEEAKNFYPSHAWPSHQK